MNQRIESLLKLISSNTKTVIVTHPNPDGDAFGSSFALSLFLQKLGHTTTVVSPSNFTANFKWLPAYDTLLSFENKEQKLVIEKVINEAELIFCLDFNALNRIEKVGELVGASSAQKVMVDHHQQPEDFADIMFSDTSYAATCEYLYDIFCLLGFEENIDRDIAKNLYTGLTTDTGFFAFSNTTPNVHRVAGSLINKGVSPEFIQDKVFNIYREERLRYTGYCLLNKLKVVNKGTVAYIMVSKEEARQFHLQPGDNEGLVNYPFRIEGVKVSVMFTEEPEKVKISFRSKEQIDVNTFARQFFSGGGHRNAAGGKSLASLADTEALFLEKLPSLIS
jgi:phosphoesterase RecJ-like protein